MTLFQQEKPFKHGLNTYSLNQSADINNANIIITWKTDEKIIEHYLQTSVLGTRSIIAINAGNYKEEFLDKFLMHQIGHAIGIWGHSSNKNDIMFNFEETKGDVKDIYKYQKISLKIRPKRTFKTRY
ncbi:MAG: hypothetical protein M0C28_39730 [Candidatus Moduliflexus flocculans]|nr:hypothetical protein [Candidatus Moduliflexus flocculans]